MKSVKLQSKLLVACVALISVVALLKADYYKPDFFPIGLTGLNYTGYDRENSCPYGNDDLLVQWGWDSTQNFTNNEKALIEALGVNCIGCQDAYHRYLIAWGDTNTPISSRNNYLCKICRPTIVDADPTNNIYLITASYRTSLYRDYWHECSTSPDSIRHKGNDDIGASALFRSFKRGGGYGYYLFDPAGNPNSFPDCIGTDTDNWNTCDGDTVWQKMADTAVITIEKYLQKYTSDNIRECIWGYNLISEDPAFSRRGSSTPAWHGVWAAVDRVFTSHRYETSQFKGLTPPSDSSLKGIRGAEDNVGMAHRMFMAKCETWPLHKSNYNIFQYLPDLDVIVAYYHVWCRAWLNYGDQDVFDNLLYGVIEKQIYPYQEKIGYHNTAIYIQQYGNTPGGPAGQERRWIAVPSLEWSGLKADSARCRRPCPPEIRCVVYLSFSRGAKGFLFHPWLTNYEDSPANIDDFPSNLTIPIPITDTTRTGDYPLGLRDCEGYPFGHPAADTHFLNNGEWGSGDSTYWHGPGRRDHTYYYLDTLITELKKITPTLIKLDWVNAYSLNSTAPEWRSTCPHYYVDDVWGADFMELAFFDHPYEPVGVEYFMLVNREGIADMTNRNVGVALDASHWPEEDTLILTDIADADSPKRLVRQGDRYVFTEVFEPGEGKLYRVAPINETPITLVPSTEGGVR